MVKDWKLSVFKKYLYFFVAVCFCFSNSAKSLIPQPGIEPWPVGRESSSPNHWIAREFPKTHSSLKENVV